MKLLEKMRKLLKPGDKQDPASMIVRQPVACGAMSHEELYKKLQSISMEQTDYRRLSRKDHAILFVQTDDIGEDISAIEFVLAEAFLKLDIEDEIATMGDFLTENGIIIDETRTRRVAIVAICDSFSTELSNMIQQSTYEEPVGFPPQSCYNLSIGACINPTSNEALFSPRTKLLTREYQTIIDDMMALIALCDMPVA